MGNENTNKKFTNYLNIKRKKNAKYTYLLQDKICLTIYTYIKYSNFKKLYKK